MSNILSDTVIRAEPLETAPAERSARVRWPRRILFLLLLLWAVDSGISLVIQHSQLRRKLTARLEAGFGRPVEVGSYAFSLWRGPALEARSVTVGEDARFGHEYFLRAESLTVRLRWQSLFLGRFEAGTLSLARPSLNIVRNSDGDWNLAEWLPHPAGFGLPGAPVGAAVAPSQPTLRFGRIEVDSGRINFKRGDEKLPFAFTSVKGYVEPDGPGRWSLDLEAIPSRAAVAVQQAGVLHLAGDLGGTSSRLRPATLDLAWQGASISDVLRLTRGYDYGVRGTLALMVDAHTSGDAWMLNGRADLKQLHRWDLGARQDNPSVNLIARGKLDLIGSRLELTEATLETPHSNAHASGAIDWNHATSPEGFSGPEESSGTELQVTTPGIDLNDALAWFRAFHSGVADALSLGGVVKLDMTFRGWPPRPNEGSLSIDGAALSVPGMAEPVRLDSAQVRYHKDEIRLAPATIRFGITGGRSAGIIRLDESPAPDKKGYSNLRLAGSISQVRDFLTTASALGWNLSRGWDAAGPASFEFLWAEARRPLLAQVKGNILWGDGPGGGSLRAPFLNQPVEQIKAAISIGPGARNIALNSAEAFGARWKGSFDLGDPAAGWQFSLSADRLAAADVDRWLNPRWQQSFLDRMLPFLSARSAANAAPESLRASGRIRVEHFTLAPFTTHRIEGDLIINGRHVVLTNAKAEFYGGNIGASLEAELEKEPAYHVGLDFSRVDLGALAAASLKLENLFGGVASGRISFDARGGVRSDLLASLECEGAARVSQAQLRGLSFTESRLNMARSASTSVFPEASAAFTCGEGTVRFQKLVLASLDEEVTGTGSVDFSDNLDFRLKLLPGAGVTQTAKASFEPAAAFHVSGSLSAPVISRVAAAAPRPR